MHSKAALSLSSTDTHRQKYVALRFVTPSLQFVSQSSRSELHEDLVLM